MIALRYQVFFFDPNENRESQLSAIQPMFQSPSAIKALIKTAKYEKKNAFVYTGEEDDIEQLLKSAQRKDTTDWLAYGAEELEKALDAEAEEIGLHRFECNDETYEEQQVLGDPPMIEDARMSVEAARARKIDRYPTDIPAKNHWLWDNISLNFRKAMRRCGKDLDRQEAAKRILYQAASQKLGLIPYSHTTVKEQHDVRSTLCRDIEQGEEKASDLIETWERHLKSEGVLLKTKAMKYLGSDFEEKASRYYIAHTLEWTLGVEWKTLRDYLTKNHAFQAISNDHLTMTINKLTKLEIVQDSDETASLFISHVFTPHQAATLTGKADKDEIVKTLHKYSKEWYKNGTFPNIKLAVAEVTEEGQEPPETSPVTEEKPGDVDLQRGSAHPDNWQTAIQTGKSHEELRQDAIKLADLLLMFQEQSLVAEDLFKSLTANNDKYLHMFEPILTKGLSRSKLEAIVTICSKFANLTSIV